MRRKAKTYSCFDNYCDESILPTINYQSNIFYKETTFNNVNQNRQILLITYLYLLLSLFVDPLWLVVLYANNIDWEETAWRRSHDKKLPSHPYWSVAHSRQERRQKRHSLWTSNKQSCSQTANTSRRMLRFQPLCLAYVSTDCNLSAQKPRLWQNNGISSCLMHHYVLVMILVGLILHNKHHCYTTWQWSIICSFELPPRHERPGIASCIQIRRPRQTALRVQCLVGLHDDWWSTSHRSCRRSWSPGRSDGPTTAQLVEDYDDTLFSHLMNSEQHVLHQLLPAQSDHHYNLRPRPHNLSLSYAMDHRNFIPRLAFKDTY